MKLNIPSLLLVLDSLGQPHRSFLQSDIADNFTEGNVKNLSAMLRYLVTVGVLSHVGVCKKKNIYLVVGDLPASTRHAVIMTLPKEARMEERAKRVAPKPVQEPAPFLLGQWGKFPAASCEEKV